MSYSKYLQEYCSCIPLVPLAGGMNPYSRPGLLYGRRHLVPALTSPVRSGPKANGPEPKAYPAPPPPPDPAPPPPPSARLFAPQEREELPGVGDFAGGQVWTTTFPWGPPRWPPFQACHRPRLPAQGAGLSPAPTRLYGRGSRAASSPPYTPPE